MVKLAKFIVGALAVFGLAMIVIVYIKDYKNDYNEELTSTYMTLGEDVEVTIPKDSSVKEIAAILHDAGLIRHERAFVERLQKSEYAGRLKAGTYTLNTGMNTLKMMETMSKEDDSNKVLQTLVIPEGFTVDQIAARCEEQKICTRSEFINAVKSVTSNDFEYLEDVPSGANVRYKLEGYLFPATYNIYKDTTAVDLVDMMLVAFKQNYTSEMNSQATARGLNSYQVITMASMIEREAKIPEERPKIAGVINNRMSKDMLLQIDPTILYPLTEGMYDKGALTYEDLEYKSPYNTYLHKGLPPGPICNPGVACINAVLAPEEHGYYFYHIVNEDTGEHVFTETFEEHENTMIGGADIDGDGIPDEGAGSDVEDNNAASDVWSNKEDDE